MRFFIDQPLQGAETVFISNAAIVHQIMRVFRQKAGGEIALLDGSGIECIGVIDAVQATGVRVTKLACAHNPNEPKNEVTLYQSMLKKDKMEWVFEKCTEVGVSRFVPVLSAHSIKRGLDIKRARAIVKEAAEQSRRGKIPVVAEPVSFAQAQALAQKEKAQTFFAHNGEDLPELQDVFTRAIAVKKTHIWIGPEGGFSKEEVALAKQNGFSLVSLGLRPFRAETAAVVASFLVVR